jgi:broad specificity phosphatase PhoE
MNRLLLVRHGENTANLTLEFSHRKVDYSLTPKGVLQAEQTAQFLRGEGIQEVFASPLKRAVETAAIIAAPHGLQVMVIEQFREVNVGDFENQPPTAELWTRHNAIIAGWFNGRPEETFPGGENLEMLVARARSGFLEILAGKQNRTILVAAHGGIFTFALQRLVPNIDRALLRKGMANCAVTELRARAASGFLEMEVVSYASATHLSGVAAQLVPGVPGKGSLRQLE